MQGAYGWHSFFLVSLIAADNFLWRIASWTASFTFVGVTGDLRRDIFRHLTGHAPSYFSDRLPGMLSSRITATSYAVFTVENMLRLECAAAVHRDRCGDCADRDRKSADGGRIDRHRRGDGGRVCFIWRPPASRCTTISPTRPPAVDGEMVDVINNMPLVRAFCGLSFEHDRFDATVHREVTARGRSLRYLEKLRLTHAAITVALTIGLLAWAIVLWQRSTASNRRRGVGLYVGTFPF